VRRARTIGSVSSGRNASGSLHANRQHIVLRLCLAAAGACRDVQSPAGHFPDSPRADKIVAILGAEAAVAIHLAGIEIPGNGGGLQGPWGTAAADGGPSGDPMEKARLQAPRQASASGPGMPYRRQARGGHWASQPSGVVKPGSEAISSALPELAGAIRP